MQNKLSSVVLTAAQTNMSLVFLQMSAERMFAGKLFHTKGPATVKLHVPSTVLVLGTTRHQLSADQSALCPPQL